MSNIRPVGSETLWTLPASVTKNAWTAEAAFSGVVATNPVCGLDPGWLMNEGLNPIGRMLRLKAAGTIQNTAAATFAAALGMDPTAGTKNQGIVINTAYTPTASVTAQWDLEALYVCTAFATSTCTFQVNGFINYGTVAAGGAVSTTTQRGTFAGTHATIDPRVVNYIELFGTWSASSASNQTVLQQMLLEGLN